MFEFRSPQPNCTGRQSSLTTVFLLFNVELVSLLVLYRPVLFGFDNYMFRDWGFNLVVKYLISNGFLPNIDFGYNYGLLTLLFGDTWYTIFGATPRACQAAMLLMAIAAVWALVRAAVYIKISRYKWAFLVVMLPFGVRLAYANLAHSIDAALISNAVVEQLQGRRSRALALCTIAVFVRPAVGFIYGLILVVAMVTSCKRDCRAMLRELLPAVVTALLLATILGIVYGPQALVRTILPINGMRNYRAAHAGFFRSNGRSFYYYPHVSIGFYIGGPTGVWIACTLWLYANASIALNRVATIYGSLRDEVVVTCALLHTAFVTLIFGPPGTWTYCSYILVMAVIVANQTSAWISRFVILTLLVLGFLSYKTDLRELQRLYTSTRPQSQAYNLWVSNAEIKEWQRVLTIVKGHRTAFLVAVGSAALTAPELEKPVALSLTAGHSMAPELKRQVEMMRQAEFVLSPISSVENVDGPSYGDVLEYYPELFRGLRDDTVSFKGKYFIVFHKRSTGPR